MTDLILELVEGKEPGLTFPLGGEMTVGRDPSQAIALADDQVSRRHATFTVVGDQVTLQDLGSRNGTYVNGQVLQGSRQLVPGDQVRLGLTVLELRSREQVAAQPSAVQPTPQITSVGADVLRPAAEAELAPAPPTPPEPDPVAGGPGLRAEEAEPAFIPDAIRHGEAAGADREGYDALAALVDSRVKRQTNVAAFALLAVAALALIIYLGVTL